MKNTSKSSPNGYNSWIQTNTPTHQHCKTSTRTPHAHVMSPRAPQKRHRYTSCGRNVYTGRGPWQYSRPHPSVAQTHSQQQHQQAEMPAKPNIATLPARANETNPNPNPNPNQIQAGPQCIPFARLLLLENKTQQKSKGPNPLKPVPLQPRSLISSSRRRRRRLSTRGRDLGRHKRSVVGWQPREEGHRSRHLVLSDVVDGVGASLSHGQARHAGTQGNTQHAHFRKRLLCVLMPATL